MTRKEVVLAAIQYQEAPYVPWEVRFTANPTRRLREHFGADDLDACIGNHMHIIWPASRRHEEIAPGMFRDMYGSVWDRTVDPDIGTLAETALKGPSLKGFRWPECAGGEEKIHKGIAAHGDVAIYCSFGFALFERAWALRGMENLLLDFIEHPAFAHELFDAICEHDLKVLDWVLQFNPDIINFGDDWGQQHGLIMGPRLWREFIKPRLQRLYDRTHAAGKLVSIHTCGDVVEILDELIEMGVNLFNPFQPEVMDVVAIKKKYQGRLAFHGGMSIQRVLPFGTPAEVRAETQRLVREIGCGGGYVFAPAHAVPADVPTENLLAFMEVLVRQPGFENRTRIR